MNKYHIPEEQIPDTGEVRGLFSMGEPQEGAAFDVWLKRVTSEACEEAWYEGFSAGRNADHNPCWWPRNPYRGENK